MPYPESSEETKQNTSLIRVAPGQSGLVVPDKIAPPVIRGAGADIGGGRMEPAPTIGLLCSGSPVPSFWVGAANLAGTEGAGEKLALFYLENEVY